MFSLMRTVVQLIILLVTQLIQPNNGNISCGHLELPVENLLKLENNSVPWAAILSRDSDPPGTFPIPGTIVSPSLIYTSAIWIKGKNRPIEKFYATVGTTEFNSTPPNAQRIPVSFFTIHPEFKDSDDWRYNTNEYALAHLAYPMNISASVQPACFPSFEEKESVINSPGYDSLYIAGWTRNDYGQFRALRLKVLEHNECRSLYISNAKDGILGNRYCGNVTEANESGSCVHRGIGSFFLKNGSFYFGAHVSDFFSNQGVCSEQTLNFIWSHNKRTHQWIRNSIDCGLGNFTCFSSKKCFPQELLCNGVADCADKSDEQQFACKNPRICLVGELQCKIHGACVPESKLRDGHPDCPELEETRSVTFLGIISSVIAVGVILIAFGYVWSILTKPKIPNLTQADIDEFFKGEVSSQVRETSDSSSAPSNSYMTVIDPLKHYDAIYINSSILATPWNGLHEIPLEDLKIGEKLGQGEYGIVFKGQLRAIKKRPTAGELAVAVKTQLKDTSVDGFKNLLREIKITANVGAHPAVVSFKGACTQNIRKRKAYLILELCSIGYLQMFLTKQELSKFKNSRDHWMDSSSGTAFSMSDLPKWAYQIASGMAHLVKQNVIHGDLAARNVLLNETLDAKISDFGLSRELNDTDIYVKTTDQRMPLKWLAIESITKKIYSQKSDVWAYGVTLWEIFSLGETPYKDTVCNSEFVTMLQNGFRLPAPEYASQDISRIIMRTWDADPDNRPTFEVLEKQFSSIIKNVQ